MKVRVDIDLTPEEARRFLGLPDVSALQEDVVRYAREQLEKGAEGFDAAAFLRETTVGGTRAWQRLMSAAFSKASEAAQAYAAGTARAEDDQDAEDTDGGGSRSGSKRGK